MKKRIDIVINNLFCLFQIFYILNHINLYFRNTKKKIAGSRNYKSSSLLTDESVSIDLNAATFLDVAVLRCLFVPQWCEEGVYWALQFLYHRFVARWLL